MWDSLYLLGHPVYNLYAVDDIHIYFREQTTESQIESGLRRNFVTGVNVKYYPESYIKELKGE